MSRWVQAAREEGRREAKPSRGGPEPVIRDEAAAARLRLVEGRNDRTLAACAATPGPSAGRSSGSGGRATTTTLRASERDRDAIVEARPDWRTAAAGIEGVTAAMTSEAATSGAVVHAFQVLLPELRRAKPAAVIVMDNLSAHQTRAVRDRLERSGLGCRYLPPYAPDLNPIEPAWAKMKARRRAAAAHSVAARHAAGGAALDAVTPGDAAGFFRHAGYGA